MGYVDRWHVDNAFNGGLFRIDFWLAQHQLFSQTSLLKTWILSLQILYLSLSTTLFRVLDHQLCLRSFLILCHMRWLLWWRRLAACVTALEGVAFGCLLTRPLLWVLLSDVSHPVLHRFHIFRLLRGHLWLSGDRSVSWEELDHVV